MPAEPIGSPDPAPETRSLGALARAARTCRACPLYARATQTVFSEGPARAAIVLVGEQPGDVEDREGQPFVGPAGAMLDRAIETAGLDRNRLYLTNAVKHFSWQPAAGRSSGERGKRRIHKKPRASEVKACRPWLDAELAHLKPGVIVCMGASRCSRSSGSNVPIGASRGHTFETALGPAIVTRHPSSILRQIDKASRKAALDELVGGSAARRAAYRETMIGPAWNSSFGPRRGISASRPSTSSPIARTLICGPSMVTRRKCGVSLHDIVCASAKSIGTAAPQLAGGAGHEVVDALDLRVLEVVLVAAEHHPYAGVAESRRQRVHVLRVVMARSRRIRRMVAERNPPPDSGRVGNPEALLEKRLMLGMLEQPAAREEMFL